MIEEMLLTSKLHDKKRLKEILVSRPSPGSRWPFQTAGHSIGGPARHVLLLSSFACFRYDRRAWTSIISSKELDADFEEKWEMAAGEAYRS